MEQNLSLLFGRVIHIFCAVHQRRHPREGRRVRPPRSYEDGAHPNNRIPEAGVDTSETDDLARDFSGVVERGWLEIGFEVLGKFLLLFLFSVRWL